MREKKRELTEYQILYFQYYSDNSLMLTIRIQTGNQLIMTKISVRLSLLVLLGTLSMGFSSIAKAGAQIQWLPADYKRANLDCPSACRKNSATPYPMAASLDKNHKPLSICLTKKEREWLVGYNRWQEKTCVVGIEGQAYQGTDFYCLCSDIRTPRIFR